MACEDFEVSFDGEDGPLLTAYPLPTTTHTICSRPPAADDDAHPPGRLAFWSYVAAVVVSLGMWAALLLWPLKVLYAALLVAGSVLVFQALAEVEMSDRRAQRKEALSQATGEHASEHGAGGTQAVGPGFRNLPL